MKKALNSITARVKLQVALRSGQRTSRSSTHDPLKYPPILANTDKGFLPILATLTTVDFERLMSCLSFMATLYSYLNSLPKADCQVTLYLTTEQ